MKRWICAALCLLLLLSGCGQAVPDAGDASGEAADKGGPSGQTASGSAEAGDRAAGTNAASKDTAAVINNGGYYVSVDGLIYFRQYGPDALRNEALYGGFTEEWNSTGDVSQVIRYDPAEGELETAWEDMGTGPLWYGDGGFYTQEKENDTLQVVWHSLDDTVRRDICKGELYGVTAGGLTAAFTPGELSGGAYRFFRNRQEVRVWETEESFHFAGLTEDGLFLIRTGPEEQPGGLTLWQITPHPDAEPLCLGALPETGEEYASMMQVDQFLDRSGKIALAVGFYAGTALMLNDSAFAEAVPGMENSLRPLEAASLGETEDTLPRMSFDEDGTVLFSASLPGTLRVAWDEDVENDLQRFDGQEWQTVLEDLGLDREDGSGYSRVVQTMEEVDGAVYVTMACCHASPMDDIGWREANVLLEMRYLRIEDGGVQVLAAVDCAPLLAGMVWFTEDGDSLYWQQTVSVTGAGGETPAGYAFRIPVSPSAVWYGDREAALANAARIAGSDLPEGEYYGCPVPDSEGTLLWLRLNGDGEAVYLSEKSPDALLYIETGVPESALAEAVETVDLSPRASDEDLPWYWTLLTALEDGVTVRLERTPDQTTNPLLEITNIDGMFVTGSVLLNRELRQGEAVAVRVSRPWYPEVRVSASKGDLWGAYIFGEDNYLHLEGEDGSIPDMTLAGFAEDASGTGEDRLRSAMAGTWLYSPGGVEDCAARITFDENGWLRIETEDTAYALQTELDWMYADTLYTPDLLRLSSINSEDSAAAAAVQALGSAGGAGDYLLQRFRTEGEDLLHLLQANPGDGALSRLIPGAENTVDFTLRRWQGTGQPGAKLRNVTRTMMAVRYEEETETLWLQSAGQVDEYPDGSPIYQANLEAPCLPYTAASRDVVQPLSEADHPAAPMRYYEVDFDKNAVVTRLSPV